MLSAVVSLLLSLGAGAAERHAAVGLVLEVNRPGRSVTVSCREIPGFMEAMVMPFAVRDPAELDGLAAGVMIDFTVIVEESSSHIEDVRRRRFASADQQALEVGRLKLLERITAAPPAEPRLEPGRLVPDFTLIDQNRQAVRLADLSGKVVAVSFMYTTCRLPEYCFRLSNNFGLLQKRFAKRLGKDLVLLTITFDPEHDQPEVLAKYAATWKADARGWHLLTGPVPDVRRVCRMFGMDAWPEMGMITHDMHTIVIDQERRLVANLEGNEFSARQLGDLVLSVMDGAPGSGS